jgi:hypothetical protein
VKANGLTIRSQRTDRQLAEAIQGPVDRGHPKRERDPKLRSGSRRGRVPAVRTKTFRRFVENYKATVAEVAGQVGI